MAESSSHGASGEYSDLDVSYSDLDEDIEEVDATRGVGVASTALGVAPVVNVAVTVPSNDGFAPIRGASPQSPAMDVAV